MGYRREDILVVDNIRNICNIKFSLVIACICTERHEYSPSVELLSQSKRSQMIIQIVLLFQSSFFQFA